MKSLTKVIAGVLGLAGFGVAVIAGLAAGNAPTDVLVRALAAMAICHVLGLVIGSIGERTVNEYVESYAALRVEPAAAPASAGDNSSGTVDKSVNAKSTG